MTTLTQLVTELANRQRQRQAIEEEVEMCKFNEKALAKSILDHPEFDAATFAERHGAAVTLRTTWPDSEKLHLSLLEPFFGEDYESDDDMWTLAGRATATTRSKTGVQIVMANGIFFDVTVPGAMIQRWVTEGRAFPPDLMTALNLDKPPIVSFARVRRAG